MVRAVSQNDAALSKTLRKKKGAGVVVLLRRKVPGIVFFKFQAAGQDNSGAGPLPAACTFVLQVDKEKSFEIRQGTDPVLLFKCFLPCLC